MSSSCSPKRSPAIVEDSSIRNKSNIIDISSTAVNGFSTTKRTNLMKQEEIDFSFPNDVPLSDTNSSQKDDSTMVVKKKQLVSICIDSADEPLESVKNGKEMNDPNEDDSSLKKNIGEGLSQGICELKINKRDECKQELDESKLNVQTSSAPNPDDKIINDDLKEKKRSKPLIRSGAVRESSLSPSPPPPPTNVAKTISNGFTGSSDNNHLTVAYNTNNNSSSNTSNNATSLSTSKNSSMISSDASSPSLSRDSSSENQEMSIADVKVFLTETLKKSLKDRQFLYKIEQDLTQFVKDSTKESLKIQQASSYNRMLIHKTAEYFQLEHGVSTTHSSIILTKNQNTAVPLESFHEIAKDLQVSVEEPKKSILKRDSTSLDDSPGSSFDKDKSPDSYLNGGLLSDSSRSRSLEEREENYEKVRARIFNQDSAQTGGGNKGLIENSGDSGKKSTNSINNSTNIINDEKQIEKTSPQNESQNIENNNCDINTVIAGNDGDENQQKQSKMDDGTESKHKQPNNKNSNDQNSVSNKSDHLARKPNNQSNYNYNNRGKYYQNNRSKPQSSYFNNNNNSYHNNHQYHNHQGDQHQQYSSFQQYQQRAPQQYKAAYNQQKQPARFPINFNNNNNHHPRNNNPHQQQQYRIPPRPNYNDHNNYVMNHSTQQQQSHHHKAPQQNPYHNNNSNRIQASHQMGGSTGPGFGRMNQAANAAFPSAQGIDQPQNPFLLRLPGVLNPAAFNQYTVANPQYTPMQMNHDQFFPSIAYMNPSAMVAAPPPPPSLLNNPSHPHNHHHHHQQATNVPNQHHCLTSTANTATPANLPMQNNYSLIYANLPTMQPPNAIGPHQAAAAAVPYQPGLQPPYSLINAPSCPMPMNIVTKNDSIVHHEMHENMVKNRPNMPQIGSGFGSGNGHQESSTYNDRIAQIQFPNYKANPQQQQQTPMHNVCYPMPGMSSMKTTAPNAMFINQPQQSKPQSSYYYGNNSSKLSNNRNFGASGGNNNNNNNKRGGPQHQQQPPQQNDHQPKSNNNGGGGGNGTKLKH